MHAESHSASQLWICAEVSSDRALVTAAPASLRGARSDANGKSSFAKFPASEDEPKKDSYRHRWQTSFHITLCMTFVEPFFMRMDNASHEFPLTLIHALDLNAQNSLWAVEHIRRHDVVHLRRNARVRKGMMHRPKDNSGTSVGASRARLRRHAMIDVERRRNAGESSRGRCVPLRCQLLRPGSAKEDVWLVPCEICGQHRARATRLHELLAPEKRPLGIVHEEDRVLCTRRQARVSTRENAVQLSPDK